MSTTTLHISLPESLKKGVRARAEEEHYGNTSDYVHALIREDLKHRDEEKLEQMLLHGIASGARELTPAAWQAFKQEILASAKR